VRRVVYSRSVNVSGLNIASCSDATRLGYTWNDDSNTFDWTGGPLVPTGKWFLAAIVVEADKATAYAEYHNERWHFSLAVPADMKVDEYERESSGQAMVFSNASGTKEFYISAWPYTQLDLTLDREGTADGASDQPDHLEIVNVMRDDLFTVLFQKDGVRYNVYTMPELEPWLIQILKTWQFVE